MNLPNIILPGYLAGSSDYIELAETLRSQGLPAIVVPLQWWEWLPTVGGRSIAPILEKLDQTVQQVRSESGAAQVNIIAHSAGGWLARIYLGDRPYYHRIWNARDRVAKLVTLGTPQRSLEPWTRKNLGFVNDAYPDAFYDDVKYICVAGRSVYGKRFSKWIAYSSYELTCGTGSTWGDGITPIEAAHLKGAENLVYEGVNHSPKAGTWYGSPTIVTLWAKYLV
jgi:pimeloyl-ACP methyl ester carboxylesterase